jgi:hypothetical protein
MKEHDIRQRIESILKMPAAVAAVLVAALMGLACGNSGLQSKAGDAGVASGGQAGSTISSGTTGGTGGGNGQVGAGGAGIGGTIGSGGLSVTDAGGHAGTSESKDALPSSDLSVPPDSGGFAGVRDTGLAQDSRPETQDALATVDLPAQPDSGQGSEATPAAQCATQVLDSVLFPVSGTVRGPRVDAEVCDNGLGTFFLGPQDYAPLTPYEQDFFTTSVYGGAVPRGSNGPGVYGFMLRAPADALSADLSGSTGASAPAVGTYDSATNCGELHFDVTLPIPPGVVCRSEFGPCDPGCEGYGEMFICEPANAMMHYQAGSAACGQTQYPSQGDWQLTITSVSALAVPDGYQHFQTHGHLTATLVNQGDPSDSVVLNLDF